MIDFLSVSAPLGNFRQPDCPIVHLLPRTDGQLQRALATMPGLANTVFRDLFPDTSLRVAPFQERAFQGYTMSAPIMALGVESPVGVVCVGGNAGTVFVSLTGSGCAFLHEWARYALTLEGLGARITRVDCAVDDLAGESLNVRALAAFAAQGGFKGRGGLPSMRLVDDLGTGKGCTLYVGQKGAKELCCYEKGIQLGDPESPWVRAEVRLWSKNRKIPLDVLTEPAAYVVGEFPGLAPFLQIEGAKRSQVMKAQSEATLDAAARWLRNAGGKTLDVLRRAADRADLHPDELIQSLSREGKPRRFKGLPDAVVLHWGERRVRYREADECHGMQDAEYDETGARVRLDY